MVSVTQRIKKVTQPRGGYLPGKDFEKIQLPLERELHLEENISPVLVGIVVDYLTRFAMGSAVEEAFHVSLLGARCLGREEFERSVELLKNIKGLDDDSIFYACQMVGYDSAYRAGTFAYRPVQGIQADKKTIENVSILVERSIAFFEEYGPVVLNGIQFGADSLSVNISSADGDFSTEDSLWDFKVSKNPPKKEHTLQLAMYYLLGLHSAHLTEYFSSLTYLAIYNPRLQKVYRMKISDIPEEVIKEIEEDVIGY